MAQSCRTAGFFGDQVETGRRVGGVDLRSRFRRHGIKTCAVLASFWCGTYTALGCAQTKGAPGAAVVQSVARMITTVRGSVSLFSACWLPVCGFLKLWLSPAWLWCSVPLPSTSAVPVDAAGASCSAQAACPRAAHAGVAAAAGILMAVVAAQCAERPPYGGSPRHGVLAPARRKGDVHGCSRLRTLLAQRWYACPFRTDRMSVEAPGAQELAALLLASSSANNAALLSAGRPDNLEVAIAWALVQVTLR